MLYSFLLYAFVCPHRVFCRYLLLFRVASLVQQVGSCSSSARTYLVYILRPSSQTSRYYPCVICIVCRSQITLVFVFFLLFSGLVCVVVLLYPVRWYSRTRCVCDSLLLYLDSRAIILLNVLSQSVTTFLLVPVPLQG